MPRRPIVAEIVETDSDDEDTRINIESTPTPSSSEDEQPTMKKVNAIPETEKAMEAIPVKDDTKVKKERKPRKPLTEERKAQLSAMRQARKEKKFDSMESNAILFLKDRGFSVERARPSGTKQSEAKSLEDRTIHLSHGGTSSSGHSKEKEVKSASAPNPAPAPSKPIETRASVTPSPSIVKSRNYNPFASNYGRE